MIYGYIYYRSNSIKSRHSYIFFNKINIHNEFKSGLDFDATIRATVSYRQHSKYFRSTLNLPFVWFSPNDPNDSKVEPVRATVPNHRRHANL